MVKTLKIVLATFILSGLTIALFGCAKADSTVSESQIVTVQRGDLRIDITAVGNLALSLKEDLAFEIPGTVEEVLVEEGDSVEGGQLLAKLDTSKWEEQVGALEDKVTAAERNLTAKKRAVTQAKRQVTAKKRDLLQAEINLKNAENALFQAHVLQWPEVEFAQAELDRAKYSAEYAHKRLADAPDDDKEHWARLVAKAEENLVKAEERLNLLLSGTPTDELTIKKMQLEITRGKLEDAQLAVEDAQLAVGDAEIAIEDAQKALEDAQQALAEAMDGSPEITAPFAGFITKVNVKGGGEVKKGTVAVVIADPNKFEADILVNEMDIFQLKLGGDASIRVDAMPMINLPAKVTSISPTATIQQGVVNYKVKVEIQSLEAMRQERQQAMPEAREGMRQGELPARLKQAIEEGRLTQEQAEEMMKRFQQAAREGRFPQERFEEMMKQRQAGEGGLPEGQQAPTIIPEGFQLREGLTVTVSILVNEKKGVLLVPNKAITSQKGQTYVQVLKDGAIEPRSIKTGISNWQYTEVTDGLTEGEKVVVPKTTTPETQEREPRMLFFPRGGMRR